MWLEIAKLAATALFGALVTLATTKYIESKRRQAEYDEQTVQHQAIYTALFAIRNFIAESLNQIDDLHLARAPDQLPILKVAADRLEGLVRKAPIERPDMAMVLYDLSLRLKTVVVVCEEGINSDEQERRLKIAINGLIGSLEQFELLSGASLQFITEEELAKFPNYPLESNQP